MNPMCYGIPCMYMLQVTYENPNFLCLYELVVKLARSSQVAVKTMYKHYSFSAQHKATYKAQKLGKNFCPSSLIRPGQARPARYNE
jgi:hypothetical protein